MIVIKFSVLSSYTKLISSMFREYREKELNQTISEKLERVLICKTTVKNKDKLLELELKNKIYYDNVYNKYFEKIQKIKSTNNDEFFYFDNLEFFEHLSPNFLKKFIEEIGITTHKIHIILPLIDANKRLFSIIFRKNYIKQIKETNIDELLKHRFALHIDVFNNSDLLYGREFIDFNFIILYKYLEDIIKELNDNVKLICVSEETILNNPKLIFDELKLNSEKIDFVKLVKKSERLTKEINLHKTQFYKLIIKEKNIEIKQRQIQINELINKSGVKKI